jgi:two-component system chemotaxis sensor kinase CheA
MPRFDDPEMQEIYEGFLVETNELLDNISQDLMILENEPEDLDLLNRIFRSFHTIKGTSSFMGFDSIAKITHHAEDILNKLRKSELRVNQPIIDVLLEVYDWIVRLLSKIQEDDDSPVNYQDTIEKIEQLKSGNYIEDDSKKELKITSSEDEKVIVQEQTNSGESVLESVLENKELFSKQGDFTDDELALIEKAFAEVNQSFKNQPINKEEINNDKDNLSIEIEQIRNDKIQNEEKIEDEKVIINNENIELESNENNINIVLKQNNIQQEKQPTKTEEKKSTNISTETIRVDVHRLETLMDLSGELVLGRNRLSQLSSILTNYIEDKEQLKNLEETTTQIDFITSEIQSAVMRMRMVPIGKLYQKAPRIVRDLAKEFGKKINLIVKGEETEIDRGIIEELNDPLVHMIRNSCDHGIEAPEERIKAGKPEVGTIILDADQEGNNIVLKITDDGKGMDPEKLKAKAVEKGLITYEQSLQMTAREAFQLIFAPGFSTAAKVSAVSGRGVGMDVVRTNIHKLKGIIDIERQIGKGTTFTIKLPLTLAIIQGLLVKVQDETYAIPLSSVVEVVALDPNQVSTINTQEVIRVRQEILPIVRLDKVLKTSVISQSLDKRYVVNVGLGVKRVGLVVEELLGQQEIVIKSLGDYLGSISGIAGSTIMGDGKVIMIIDVAQLLDNIYNSEYSSR